MLGILAAEQMFPILSGGFDISVGAVMAVVSIVTAMGAIEYGNVPGYALGFFLGGLLSTINGFIISKFRGTLFIVTLHMLSFTRGPALTVSNGQVIRDIPTGYTKLTPWRCCLFLVY